MKYNKQKDEEKKVFAEAAVTEEAQTIESKGVEEEVAHLEMNGNPVDELQAQAYSAGSRLLSILSEDGLLGTTDETRRAMTELGNLGRFTYNIGFAGEQSCGKSTVIDSILQYPIMPTCKLTTTASVVQMAYSETTRVRAFDDDTGKVVLDFSCMAPENGAARARFVEQFDKLLDYGISAMKILIIENFQYFSDVDVRNDEVSAADIHMDCDNPRHVLLLMLILLAVYVGQNDKNWDEKTSALMGKRQKLFRYFGIPEDAINISLMCQCDFDVLKSGLVITDLPGLGSNAQQQQRNGKKVKSHDDITKDAIGKTDTMVFITTPENRREGYEVLPEMLSNAKLNETVKKGDRIIPLLNKADTCGAKEIDAALNSFIRALENAGINKNAEDIILYSAVSGEHGFSDIPFERTLYYMENVSERDIMIKMRRGYTREEAQQEHMAYLKEGLALQYEDSGVEKLKGFFREKFVEMGKYNQAISAIHALKNMIGQGVARLENLLKSIEGIAQSADGVQKEFVEQLQAAVIRPIAKTIQKKSEKIGELQNDLLEMIEKEFTSVPHLYMSALQKGLEEYKEKLIKTINLFDTTFGGWGSKARIDQSGSSNKSRYESLQNAIDRFPVSLINVNSRYINALNKISSQMDAFYKEAIRDLEKLKKEIARSVEATIDEMSKDTKDENLVASLRTLKVEMVSFVDTQITMMKNEGETQVKKVNRAQNDIVQAIFNLNAQTVNDYTESVKSDLKQCIGRGFFMGSREYLMIDGENGIRDAVKRLSLNEEDSGNVQQNIDAGVNALLRSSVPGWTNELYSMLNMYTRLKTQVEKQVSMVKDAASRSREENEEKCAQIRPQLDGWKKAASEYRQAVQDYVAKAYDSMNDQEPGNQPLRNDVLDGCLD